jgi:hypothetical protein
VHNGIPVDTKYWDYMGNKVADLFLDNDIGTVMHNKDHLITIKLTVVDWNQAIALRKTDTHMDGEDMFLLDWSAQGDWFIIITT